MTSCRHAALLKHNRPVPRYTSYPTAPNFSASVSAETVYDWVENINSAAPVSLYFHVPFCKKMCWYCGCNTKATAQYSPVKNYLAYLQKEVTFMAKRHKQPLEVSHIHFGGGSPSYVKADDFRLLMSHIRASFTVLPDAEIAIELDPREVTESKVAAYASVGINRASLGVQDFNSTVQKSINRVQPVHQVYQAASMLRSYGIEAISFDLLYGLPNQTIDSVRESASLAVVMKPDRIALFGYAHVPWMKKHMRLIDEEKLPDAFERLEQFEGASQVLCDRGYVQIGLDHFVRRDDSMAIAHKAGRMQRNFQGYTTDNAETLIGFGPSAISSYADGYCQNTPDMRSYVACLDRGDIPVQKGIELSEEDRLRRGIISQLMSYGAVNLADIVTRYGVSNSNFESELSSLMQLEDDGLVKVVGDQITVEKGAAQACRVVASVFDQYLQSKKQQHAQVA